MYICRLVDMYMCTPNSLHLPHTEFISRVSVPAAERFVVDFEAIICRLSENPYQFPSCDDPNLADTYRKAIFAIKRGDYLPPLSSHSTYNNKGTFKGALVFCFH